MTTCGGCSRLTRIGRPSGTQTVLGTFPGETGKLFSLREPWPRPCVNAKASGLPHTGCGPSMSRCGDQTGFRIIKLLGNSITPPEFQCSRTYTAEYRRTG